MATYERLDYGSPDGCQIGDATALVAFYGKTPVDQGAAVTAVNTTAATTSTPWGFNTSTQADAIPVAINSLITRLQDIGIIA